MDPERYQQNKKMLPPVGFMGILGLYGDNGKANGNYYNGLYRV